MPCAFITGISGQDGSYLTEFLLDKGYAIYGMVRRSSRMTNLDRLTSIRTHKNLHIHYGDVTDLSSIIRILNMAYQDPARGNAPLEVYNLAAQSHVKVSFSTPMYTAQTDAIGVLNMLEAIIQLPDYSPKSVRFYQASTSELYGSTPGPQNEETLMQPQSPYAVAKLYAFWAVKNYRDIYKGFFVNGILFNHESERRAENFVTRKITQHVAQWHSGSRSPLHIGNLYARRDWGHAKDYIEAMYLMLKHTTPEDFVISTGECHTVKEFINEAYAHIGVQIQWEGQGLHEKGYNHLGEVVVVIDPNYFRPTEVEFLQGDCSKAKQKLQWQPKHSFNDLVKLMVEHDLTEFRRDQRKI